VTLSLLNAALSVGNSRPKLYKIESMFAQILNAAMSKTVMLMPPRSMRFGQGVRNLPL
jgi:hypothetical protein